MDYSSKIFVAGHNGLVGSAILRKLLEASYNNIILKSHKELDLTKQSKVDKFFKEEEPEFVFLAAAKAGGIVANATYPADFININRAWLILVDIIFAGSNRKSAI